MKEILPAECVKALFLRKIRPWKGYGGGGKILVTEKFL